VARRYSRPPFSAVSRVIVRVRQADTSKHIYPQPTTRTPCPAHSLNVTAQAARLGAQAGDPVHGGLRVPHYYQPKTNCAANAAGTAPCSTIRSGKTVHLEPCEKCARTNPGTNDRWRIRPWHPCHPALASTPATCCARKNGSRQPKRSTRIMNAGSALASHWRLV